MKHAPWKKGESGNPAGRPKGSRGVAELIRRKTKDFHVLVDKMIEIASDDSREADQIAAIKWLADRGLGKVAETQNLNHSGVVPPVSNVLPFNKATG